MGMPETTGRWTRDMVLALPDDGNRYELFDGELLVTSAPSVLHQMAVTALIKRLLPYVPAHRLGQLLTSPADLSLDGEQLAQPDLFIAPLGSGPTPTRWEDVPNPILVIEILSPSTARYDRIVKRRRHQVAGVPEYWVVDLDARVVERWRPVAGGVVGSGVWTPARGGGNRGARGAPPPEPRRAPPPGRPTPDPPPLEID